MSMNNDNEYIRELLPDSEGHIREMEEYAAENHVPIMEKDSIHFLRQMIRLQKPAVILEIGTAIGYSAIQMAEASPGMRVVSVERDAGRYEEARENREKSPCGADLILYHGDALEMKDVIQKEGPFDLLFIDAAKGQYKRFFELYTPLLREEGVIVTDNVLFKGLVADPDNAEKRFGKIAGKIRSFNDWLMQLEDFETSIVPSGDGVAITTRKPRRPKRGEKFSDER
ncbi:MULTISPECIES: O-methyltransferase [Salimicrobium]|nr:MULTISPECIES: O-methyltransferase [Salimicrobium]